MNMKSDENLSKWNYIDLISKRGSAYGDNGGVLDLLRWSNKPNTNSVTLEEAKEFWEKYDTAIKSRLVDM